MVRPKENNGFVSSHQRASHLASLKPHILVIALFHLLGLFSPPDRIFAKESDNPCPAALAGVARIRSLHDNNGDAIKAILGPRKQRIIYPNIPSVSKMHLPKRGPERTQLENFPSLSAALTDPLIEEARTLGVFDDFKMLSDLRPKAISHAERENLFAKANQAALSVQKTVPRDNNSSAQAVRKAFLMAYIEGAYELDGELVPADSMAAPLWKVSTWDSKIDKAFDYTERTLPSLVVRTYPRPGGSLLSSPYPVLIPSPGRFRESYYWDTYFGVKGLITTGRLELAQMQVENLLHAVQRHGFVPNGMRDYYLSRSQPPFLSSMVKEVYGASLITASRHEVQHLKRWLRERAFLLVKKDYEDFWMNSKTRYDSKTALNHHWDDFNLPRPERFGADQESLLGRTFRDVRAAAESGLDFTLAFEGEASNVAGVLLNSMLYKTERDLEWMAKEADLLAEADHFAQAAERRKRAMNQYLWNETLGRYENYNLRTGKTIPVLTSDTFVPLFVGAANLHQAENVRKHLQILEQQGGVMASELKGSPHQWDGTNGWAPHQVMTMSGLMRYGYQADAKRLARKWITALSDIYQRTGTMYERINVVIADVSPSTSDKYPTQIGFLWTNASFAWALTNVLGVETQPLHPKQIHRPQVTQTFGGS